MNNLTALTEKSQRGTQQSHKKSHNVGTRLLSGSLLTENAPKGHFQGSLLLF